MAWQVTIRTLGFPPSQSFLLVAVGLSLLTSSIFFAPHNVHNPLSSGICHSSVYTSHDIEMVLRSLVTLSVGKMGTFSPCCVCTSSLSAIDHAHHCPPYTATLFLAPVTPQSSCFSPICLASPFHLICKLTSFI